MTNLIFQFHDTTFLIEVRSYRGLIKNLVMFLSKIFSRQFVCRKYNKKVTKLITFVFFSIAGNGHCIKPVRRFAVILCLWFGYLVNLKVLYFELSPREYK